MSKTVLSRKEVSVWYVYFTTKISMIILTCIKSGKWVCQMQDEHKHQLNHVLLTNALRSQNLACLNQTFSVFIANIKKKHDNASGWVQLEIPNWSEKRKTTALAPHITKKNVAICREMSRTLNKYMCNTQSCQNEQKTGSQYKFRSANGCIALETSLILCKLILPLILVEGRDVSLNHRYGRG